MFTFKTKEEYVAYIKEWKSRYAHITHCIRIRRLYGKENMRIWSKAVLMSGARNSSDIAILKAFDIAKLLRTELSEHHKKLEATVNSPDFFEYSSEDATKALEELKLAKIEAQRQYSETKNYFVA